MVRGKGFEPLNLYGRDLKSRAFGQLDYPRAMLPNTSFDIIMTKPKGEMGFWVWHTVRCTRPSGFIP